MGSNSPVCSFCFCQTAKRYGTDNSVEVPDNVNFDSEGITALQQVLEKILKTKTDFKKLEHVCQRCNRDFKRFYSFMYHYAENILPPVKGVVIRLKKLNPLIAKIKVERDDDFYSSSIDSNFEHDADRKPVVVGLEDVASPIDYNTKQSSRIPAKRRKIIEKQNDIQSDSSFPGENTICNETPNKPASQIVADEEWLNDDILDETAIKKENSEQPLPVVKAKAPENSENPCDIYSCDLCGAKFTTLQPLKYHRRAHTGDTFDCKYCGAKFIQRKYLRAHMEGHGSKSFKRYQSKTLGYGLTTERSSDDGQSNGDAETGKDNFKCEQCDSKYTYQFQLDIHRRFMINH